MHSSRRTSKEISPLTRQFPRKLSASAVAVAGMLAIMPSTFAASRLTVAPSTLSIRTVSMKTSHIGWAVTKTAIMRTTDGGRRWENVSPPIPLDTASSSYLRRTPVWDFLNTRSAWVVAATDHAHQVKCSYTHDGGAHWKTFTSTLPTQKMPLAILGEADFVNSRDGWLVFGPAGVAGVDELYATTNGGRSWHHLARNTPLVGPVFFTTTNTGWMTISEPFNGHGPLFAIESTRNGGRHWTISTMKSVNGLQTIANMTASGMHDLQPTFTVGTTRNPYVAVLRSADGGRRWGAMSPRLSVNPRDFWSVQTVGGTVAIAIASGRLWTSTNGARSWAYRSADAFLNHATGLDFVNAQVGWVWKTTANGTRWWMTTSDGRQWTTWGSTLWQTNDGARH